MYRLAAPLLFSFALQSAAHFQTDPLTYGPELELVHLYEGQWPTGITVSRSGRKFSNYPPGLDPENTNDGSNGKITVGELIGNDTERAYPSVEWNNPPGGQINYTTTPPSGANYENYLVSVQSVVLDAQDRLWILDTGRALTPEGVLVPATVGGPKLVGVDLSNDSVFQTIVFPNTVAYPDTYLNDVRIDLRPHISASGKGVAYITDSSLEGRNGIIIVDLGLGESWRHLDGAYSVKPEDSFTATVWGQPLYNIEVSDKTVRGVGFGSDGITLSADGERLFYGPVASRNLYSASTAALRERGSSSELLAKQSVLDHGQKGLSDGYETDSTGVIYVGNLEQNAISTYHQQNGSIATFVRDPRISWADTLSVTSDGYLYFVNNQLWRMASFFPGTDRRERPFQLFRAKLPGNATKALLQ